MLPHSDEMMALASAGIFALRYPHHPVTTALKQAAASLAAQKENRSRPPGAAFLLPHGPTVVRNMTAACTAYTATAPLLRHRWYNSGSCPVYGATVPILRCKQFAFFRELLYNILTDSCPSSELINHVSSTTTEC
jgi:hypothetical protein